MRITFLGDIMLTKEQCESYRKKDKLDLSTPFKATKQEFLKSDLVIANLETPITSKNFTHENYSFASPEQLVAELKNAGIDIVQTCNNHCLDRGEEGLEETIKALESYDIEYVGTRIEPGDSYKIFQIDNIKIGILAFTYGTNAFSNNNYLKKNQRYKVDLLQPQELSNPVKRYIHHSNLKIWNVYKTIMGKLKLFQYNIPLHERTQFSPKYIKHYIEAISDCKKHGADYIISCLHLGGQYNKTPLRYTKKICELSRKNGVNLVMVNHEHVIHPIDMINMTNQYFCEYSMGNFLSATGVIRPPYDKKAEYSAVYHVDLVKKDFGVLAEYSVEMFCNHLDEGGCVITEPIIDYYSKLKDERKKKKIEGDFQELANRIFGTYGVKYQIVREMKVERKVNDKL